MSLSKVKEMLKDFYPFAKERFGFDRSVNIKYLSNPQNSADPLGKTAFYESENDTVNVYVDNRHPKDILRSISHELVHHTQNCRGQLSNISTAGEQGYAQNDLHLREMERQAYELGNMCFRDWEDGYKMSRGDNMNIQEMTRTILRNLKEQKIIEVTTGDTAFEEMEAVARQWLANPKDKEAIDALNDAVERHIAPEMEAMGFQDESAYSLQTKGTLEFATKGKPEIEAEIAPQKRAGGWMVQVYSFDPDNEYDKKKAVPSLRHALQFIKKVVQPEGAKEYKPGEDPNQMELPLKEQGEPFPVGARVTHRAKTTLGVGTVVKMGKKSQERRIEWKESFRKPQTTTENIMMLDDASIKENTNMSKDISEEGFDQRLRNMVGEQIKVALENALLSEDNVDEQTATSANPKVRDELERAKTRGDPQDKYGDQIDCSRIQTQEEYDACRPNENLKKEQDDEVGEGVRNIQEQDDEREALIKAIKSQESLWQAMSQMGGMPGMGFDAQAEADRASKMVKELKAKLEALGEGLTLEEKVKAAVRGALAPAPLSLEEKIKNAIQGALLQEEDKDDDDQKGWTDSQKAASKARKERIAARKNERLREDEDKKDDDDEELTAAQKELDLDDDGEIEASDLKKLRAGETDEDVGEEAEEDGGEEDEEVNEGTDMAQTRFGQSLVPGKQVAVNMSGKPGDPEVMATVESEPDWSNGMVEVKIAEGDEAGKVKVVSTDNVWEPETNEGKRVYNRDDEDKEKNEGLSRLAEAGRRELDYRNNRLFETLKKKWIK